MSANRVVTVDRLIEDVWDGVPPRGAASTLQSHVSTLRGLLGKDRLEYRDGGYALAVADGELDAQLFEAETAEAQLTHAGDTQAAAALLWQALGRWRGEALADAAGMAWAAGETARLGELRAGALEAWLTVRLELGQHTAVVSQAEAAVSEHPLQEGLWAALMLALYRCGRQSDALRAYGRLTSMLGEELGIEPSTPLRDLEEAILLQKPDLDWHDPLRGSEWASPVRETPKVPNNLPAQLTSFLGRSDELAVGAQLLMGTRLLTVTGPGGMGKTRLAYQLAGNVLADFPDGVWVVELAPLAEANLVPGAILSALGLRDEPGATSIETVVSHVGDRRVLLVLDNCEHLVHAAEAAAAEMLRGCARLRMLATSREPLHVDGESVWTLSSLSLPQTGDPELAAGSEAMALFCERAAHAKVGFNLTEDNVPNVMSICAQTDGLPLAVELAAARVRTLSLAEIERRLSQDLDVLSKGARGNADRHASLRATLAWSHRLLEPNEQVLFRRLSVFAGGFTVAAAESVCAGEGLDALSIIDGLDSLVDKSLVSFSSSDQDRYRMLETIRSYAEECLRVAGEELVTKERLATWCAAVVRECEVLDLKVLRRLDDEHPNLLAAIDQLSEVGSPVDHGELVLGLFWWWLESGQWQTAARQLRRYLERDDRDRALEGRCLGRLCTVTANLADYPEARRYVEAAVAIALEVDDQLSYRRCAAAIGYVAWQTGDFQGAQVHLEEALALSRAAGDRVTEGLALGDLGSVAVDLGTFGDARCRYEESLVIARDIGDRHGEARMLGNLGAVSGSLGHFLDSRARYEEALRLAKELGARREEQVFNGFLGEVAVCLEEFEEASARCEEALKISRELGDRHFGGTWIGLLGEVAYGLGQLEDAHRQCEMALEISQSLGATQMAIRWHRDLGKIAVASAGYSLARGHYIEALSTARLLEIKDISVIEACGELLLQLDHAAEAARLLAATCAFSIAHNRSPSPGDQVRIEATLADVRGRLGEDLFVAASESGRSLDWDSAVSLALESLESAVI